MKTVLLGLILAFVAGTAQADDWYIVNSINKNLPQCVAMQHTPQEFIDDLQQQFGADRVTTYPEKYKDGSQFIGVVIDDPQKGPAQVPLASSEATCHKVMPDVAKAEAVLANARENVVNPWFFMSTSHQECVKASTVFEGVDSPEAYADLAARNKQPTEIKYNSDRTIALISDKSDNSLPIVMARGHDFCVIAMKLTNGK